MTRLDKFIAENLQISRNEAKIVIRKGEIRNQQQIIKDPGFKVNTSDILYYNDREIQYLTDGIYIVLNKPIGYVCSNTDENHPSIYDLLEPLLLTKKLHCAGRLDVDTTGIVLITDDGNWSHRITSPKHQCEKTYQVTLADPVQDNYITACKQGILLRGEKQVTKPARLEIINQYRVNLSIHEGKYHQVKRMFAALGNKVMALHRWQVGMIQLDDDLAVGEYRNLSNTEINSF